MREKGTIRNIARITDYVRDLAHGEEFTVKDVAAMTGLTTHFIKMFLPRFHMVTATARGWKRV